MFAGCQECLRPVHLHRGQVDGRTRAGRYALHRDPHLPDRVVDRKIHVPVLAFVAVVGISRGTFHFVDPFPKIVRRFPTLNQQTIRITVRRLICGRG